jgi:hypothetical protein
MNRSLISLQVVLLFTIAGKSQLPENNKIRFDCNATYSSVSKDWVTLNCSLYNTSRDTVYALSISCNGMQYQLQYDSAILQLNPSPLCNASWPIIIKIPPKEKVDFMAYFKVINKDKEIKLGYNLYETEKAFVLNNQHHYYQIIIENKLNRKTFWANSYKFEEK